MKRTIKYTTLIFCLLLTACGGQQKAHRKTLLADAMQRVVVESNKFAANPTHDNVMLLGDSISAELYDDSVPFYTDPVSGETTTVVNRAIPGNRIECLQYELDAHVYAEQPRGVIIAVGVNNILFNEYALTLDQFISMYEQAIDGLQAHGIWVAVRSILPTMWASPALVQEYNDKIRDMAARKGCTYYNTYPFLADEKGSLAAEYSLDGLHLNTSGLAVLVQHFFDTNI